MHYVTRTLLASVAALAIAGLLAGCKSTGLAYNPPHGTSSTYHHMYLSNAGIPGEIFVYKLPITPSSTPTATVIVGERPAMLFVDASGRLFVGHFEPTPTSVEAFSLPLTSSSTPAFTLTSSSDNPDDVAEDASGNVYLADENSGGYIDIYNGPVTSSRGPDTTISNNGVGTSGLAYPFGIAIAPNGDLYASDEDDINQFTSPFTSSSVPSASVTPNLDNYGLRVDSRGRIFVANASADGVINVYASPLTNSSSPSFNLNITRA